MLMSIGGFILGLLLVVGSLLMIKYNRAVSGMLGTPSFLSKYFGPGREYTFYILLSFVIMFLGFFVMFGYSAY